MSVNRGKQFEYVIRESFNKVLNTNVIRLADDMGGFKGKSQPCDFIVYKYPYQYAIECKSVHGNTLPFSNITDNQFRELLKMSNVRGVIAGVICWWIDKDRTLFLPIQELIAMKEAGLKSVRYDCLDDFDGHTDIVNIEGKKKRVFFEYDMESFLKEVEDDL